MAFVTALNLVFIPFHAPDDYDHFERAYMLARGQIWPQTQPGAHSGGMIDTALQRYVQQELPAIFNWPLQAELSHSLGPTAAERNARWSGEQSFTPFGAAAITYLPLIYAPQAVVIEAGLVLHLSIENTILLARELNALTAIAILFVALSVWPMPSAVILLLFMLPKTLLHLASNSPDPIYYACVVAIIALVCHVARAAAPVRFWHYALLATLFLIVCPVRPPAAVLALPVFWLAWRQCAWGGALLIACVLALSAGWTVSILTSTVTDACSDDRVPLGAKLVEFLRSAVTVIPQTFVERGRYFVLSFVGELGWGNGPNGQLNELPGGIYAAALAILPIAAAVDLTGTWRLPPALRALCGVAAVGMVGAIFLALYVTCSSYQQPVVRGIQGRYFVPVLMCLVPALAGLFAARPSWARIYEIGLYAFGVAGFGILLREGLRIYWMR